MVNSGPLRRAAGRHAKKIVASPRRAPEIQREAGVLPAGVARRRARRLRSDPLNLVGQARRRESVITAQTTIPPHLPKTLIIGAGVVGLGLAWRLAQAGCRVAVYD
ncbi:MAG: NAD(P)-binding protein, partial [Stellaceae bacterium]